MLFETQVLPLNMLLLQVSFLSSVSSQSPLIWCSSLNLLATSQGYIRANLGIADPIYAYTIHQDSFNSLSTLCTLHVHTVSIRAMSGP